MVSPPRPLDAIVILGASIQASSEAEQGIPMGGGAIIALHSTVCANAQAAAEPMITITMRRVNTHTHTIRHPIRHPSVWN